MAAKKEPLCLQLGGNCSPQPPRFLKAMDGCKEKEQASEFMLALKEGCADHFVCNWGGLRPPPTPPLFKGHRWLLQKKKTVLFATGGGLPPPTPPLFKGHRWLQRKRTGVRIYVCAKGRLCRSFCLQLGGAAPPPTPPPFQRPSTPAKKEQASGRRHHPCLR